MTKLTKENIRVDWSSVTTALYHVIEEAMDDRGIKVSDNSRECLNDFCCQSDQRIKQFVIGLAYDFINDSNNVKEINYD